MPRALWIVCWQPLGRDIARARRSTALRNSRPNTALEKLQTGETGPQGGAWRGGGTCIGACAVVLQAPFGLAPRAPERLWQLPAWRLPPAPIQAAAFSGRGFSSTAWAFLRLVREASAMTTRTK